MNFQVSYRFTRTQDQKDITSTEHRTVRVADNVTDENAEEAILAVLKASHRRQNCRDFSIIAFSLFVPPSPKKLQVDDSESRLFIQALEKKVIVLNEKVRNLTALIESLADSVDHTVPAPIPSPAAKSAVKLKPPKRATQK